MPQATKESFARALEALVRKYEADRDTYLSSQYNEAQTRTQFITPLLEALGWDVRNEAGVPYNLCEVLEEKGETHGRPDYTFRINGQTKFFLEAKSPSDELSSASIIQTKRYAWNSRDIFFAGVCDFEQFRFFDASLRPDDKRPLDGEAFHLIYKEYASNIDKFWELSRDRVAAGSLDQFLRKDRKSLLQKVPVDKDFLDNLTIWRHDLANAIHAQNPQYDAHELNDIVQRLLDRIIFIRIAEDRKVIDQRQLWDIAVIWEESGGRRNITEQLVQVFQEFNARFNGEIFKPHPCEEIKIDSLVLVKIIKQLYPPKSNYRFDVIGVELLGSIYERYLGNTLRITPKRVFIEPKPEVRKAGGVYYTPQYIVDYIVKNTVGKLVEGKTPTEVDKLRILDPACGSGSFLIGAFQFLIDWYLNYYRENPKQAKPGTMFALTRTDQDGNLRLSFYAKSLILQHNLYGVDIDQQAVEVTMMSLYLKMLEGELGIQIPKQDKLPELKYNIRCGNSLIGSDIEKTKPLTPEERQRINPFDWQDRERGFGDILKSGGFDAVIGNPPYSYMISGVDQDYFSKHYVNQDYQKDLYLLFLERYHFLLKKRGLVGAIVSNTWLQSITLRKIRRYLVNDFQWMRVLYLPEKVFSAVVDTHVIILQKEQPTQGASFVVDVRRSGKVSQLHSLPQRLLPLNGDPINVISPARVHELVHRIRACSSPLSSVCEVYNGIKPFEVGKGTPPQTRAIAESQPFVREGRRPSKEWKPLLRGGLIGRYVNLWDKDYWVRYGPWLAAPRDGRIFDAPLKIMVRQTGDSIVATLVEEGFIARNNMHILLPRSADCDLRYVLGLMNSTMMDFAYTFMNPEKDEALAEVKKQHVENLPIKTDRAKHDRIVALVERMLDLNKRRQSGGLPKAELARLEREIADTDAQIDDLVYDLYGITDEERKIIEAQA